jgi:UDPglucose 6-dehydrogenase
VQDTITPDRLVYGVAPGAAGQRSVAVLNEVYASAIAASTPLVVADYATAELVKVAANAFLATKISFINAMAEIAEVSGADVTQLADAIGFDARIGRRFLNAGVGFGGGCLPKDIREFTARAEELGRGESVAFLKEVDAINLRRRSRVVDLATTAPVTVCMPGKWQCSG